MVCKTINSKNFIKKEFACELFARERCCKAPNFLSASCASSAERFASWKFLRNFYEVKKPQRRNRPRDLLTLIRFRTKLENTSLSATGSSTQLSFELRLRSFLASFGMGFRTKLENTSLSAQCLEYTLCKHSFCYLLEACNICSCYKIVAKSVFFSRCCR